LRLQFTRRCVGREPARACRARADKELGNAGMLLRQRELDSSHFPLRKDAHENQRSWLAEPMYNKFADNLSVLENKIIAQQSTRCGLNIKHVFYARGMHWTAARCALACFLLAPIA
jgi:hypothetical protein